MPITKTKGQTMMNKFATVLGRGKTKDKGNRYLSDDSDDVDQSSEGSELPSVLDGSGQGV